MNKAFKLLLLSSLLIFGCGKAKSPTGGPEDREALKIESIFPDHYASISEKKVEINFNKEVDKRSAQSAFRFYPSIENLKIKTDDQQISLIIEEDLLADRNYYLTISKVLKDTRNNYLQDNITYTYSNGKLHDSKLFGDIIYDKDEDKELDKKLILLDQDSVTVFVKNFSGDFYDIDGLEHRPYILRSYIDKNNNGRYDIEKEPYFEKYIDSLKTENADILLSYVDTSKVVAKNVTALSNNLIRVTFSEELTKWDSLTIICDADTSEFSHYTTVLQGDKVSVVTAFQDTLDYKISFYNLVDLNENVTPVSALTFSGSTYQDTLNPTILEAEPKNGSTVKDRDPFFLITFDKIILQKDIIASLKENETNTLVDLHIFESNSYKALIKPKKALKNFNSYTFTISQETKDFNGNKLLEDYEINFMVTASE